MKKIMAMLVMVLFAFSFAGGAFAVNEDVMSGQLQEQVDNNEVETVDAVETTDEVETVETVGVVEPVELMTQESLMDGSKLGVKNKLQEKKAQFEEAKAKLQEHKSVIVENRAILKECRGSDSEECQLVREQIRKEAKPFLRNFGKSILKLMERTRLAVENSDMIDKETVLAKIDAKIVEIEELKSELESAEDLTKEEVRAKAKEMKQIWIESKNMIKKQVGKSVVGRYAGVVKSSERLSIKLERTVERLQAEGVDVTGLEELRNEFQMHLDAAKEVNIQAREQFVSGNNLEGHKLIGEAKAHLVEARVALREFVSSVKEVDGGEEVLVEVLDEAQEVDEVEAEDTEVEEVEDVEVEAEDTEVDDVEEAVEVGAEDTEVEAE